MSAAPSASGVAGECAPPLISIVMAVFENRRWVGEAIDSILRQTHQPVEIIVIDGGSRDGTLDVLRAYGARIATLVSEPDHGIYDALNKGINLASGDIIGLLHSDDLFAREDALALVADRFADPAISAVYADLDYVRRDQPHVRVRHWRSGEYHPTRLRRGWMPPHPTLYLRREVYARHGLFDTRFRIAADYDFILRVLPSLSQQQVAYVPEVLVRMRLGGASNRSLRNIVRKSKEDYQALVSNRAGGLGALLWKNLSKVRQFIRG